MRSEDRRLGGLLGPGPAWPGHAAGRLVGEIPAELGSLSNLTNLRLLSNALSGCVPSSLEDRLTYRDLGDLPFC